MISMAAERRAMKERYRHAYSRRGGAGVAGFHPAGTSFALWNARAKEAFALANAGICAAVPGRQGTSESWLRAWKEAHRRVIARIGALGRKAR